MTTVHTESATRYIQSITAVDANTDSLSISTRDPSNPNAMTDPGSGFWFTVAKPHSYVTGQAFTFTQTVESAA